MAAQPGAAQLSGRMQTRVMVPAPGALSASPVKQELGRGLNPVVCVRGSVSGDAWPMAAVLPQLLGGGVQP